MAGELSVANRVIAIELPGLFPEVYKLCTKLSCFNGGTTMKKYVVSLPTFLFLLALHPLSAEAGHSARIGRFTSRNFVVGTNQSHFVSPPVIINRVPSHIVHVRPFAREVIILPHHHFVGNTVIIREPFVCFGHGIGFNSEASFFDHLHQFHGLAFETIPRVVVHNGPQVFFFGD